MAKAIMVQGTMSNAGKSYLAASFIRTAIGSLRLNRRIWRSTPSSPRKGWKWDAHR